MPADQSRFMCGTDWRCEDYTELPLGVQFLAWALEHTTKPSEGFPEGGRPHFQVWGYGARMTKYKWAEVTGISHCELMRGSMYDSEAYCSKEGTYKTLGEKPMKSGHKRSLMDLTDAIRREPKRPIHHHGYVDAAAAPLVVQYTRGLKEFRDYCCMQELRNEGYRKKEVYILVGSPEIGKSRYVTDLHGFHDVYIMPESNGTFFGSYCGQPVILWNDVVPGDFMSITKFLNITDGYPIEVPVKGGYTPLVADCLYFTSNVPWTEWWPTLRPSHEAAIRRRVTAMLDI